MKYARVVEEVAVVDDEVACIDAYTRELVASGWKVSPFARVSALLGSSVLPPYVLLDLGLPGEDALGAIATLRRRSPATVIVVITGRGSDLPIFAALRAGAVGFLLKHDALGRLAEVMDQVRRGGAPMSPSIARRVVETFRVDDERPVLTEREREVLQCLASGLSYAEAGQTLGIALDTVRAYVRRVYEKLHVSTKSEAVARALRSGLLE